MPRVMGPSQFGLKGEFIRLAPPDLGGQGAPAVRSMSQVEMLPE